MPTHHPYPDPDAGAWLRLGDAVRTCALVIGAELAELLRAAADRLDVLNR